MSHSPQSHLWRNVALGVGSLVVLLGTNFLTYRYASRQVAEHASPAQQPADQKPPASDARPPKPITRTPVVLVEIPISISDSYQQIVDRVHAFELAVKFLPKFESMISRIGQQRFSLTVQFAPDADWDEALQQVREGAGRAAQMALPEHERHEVRVLKHVPEPILFLSLTGGQSDRSAYELSMLARENLVNPLAQVEGVGDVIFWGERTRTLCVDCSPDRLRAFGVSFDDVFKMLSGLKNPAGALLDDKQSRFVPPKPWLRPLPDIEEFGNRIVKVVGDSQVVRLRDVASSIKVFEEQYADRTLLGGELAFLVAVYPTADARPSELQDRLKQRLEELPGALPEGVVVQVPFNFTDALSGVEKSPQYIKLDVESAIGSTVEFRHGTMEILHRELRELGVQTAVSFPTDPFDRTSERAGFLIRLPADQSAEARERLVGSIRQRFEQYPQTKYSLRRLFEPDARLPLAYPLTFRLHGPSEEVMASWADQVSATLGKDASITDLNWQPQLRFPENLQLINEILAKRHVTWEQAQQAIVTAPTGRFLIDIGEGQTVILENNEGYRDFVAPKARNAEGELVSLPVTSRELPIWTQYFNGQPMVEFGANLAAGTSIEAARQAIEKICEKFRVKLKLSYEYRVTWQ